MTKNALYHRLKKRLKPTVVAITLWKVHPLQIQIGFWITSTKRPRCAFNNFVSILSGKQSKVDSTIICATFQADSVIAIVASAAENRAYVTPVTRGVVVPTNRQAGVS